MFQSSSKSHSSICYSKSKITILSEDSDEFQLCPSMAFCKMLDTIHTFKQLFSTSFVISKAISSCWNSDESSQILTWCHRKELTTWLCEVDDICFPNYLSRWSYSTYVFFLICLTPPHLFFPVALLVPSRQQAASMRSSLMTSVRRLLKNFTHSSWATKWKRLKPWDLPDFLLLSIFGDLFLWHSQKTDQRQGEDFNDRLGTVSHWCNSQALVMNQRLDTALLLEAWLHSECFFPSNKTWRIVEASWQTVAFQHFGQSAESKYL